MFIQMPTMPVTIQVSFAPKKTCIHNRYMSYYTYKGVLISCKSCSKGWRNHIHQLMKSQNHCYRIDKQPHNKTDHKGTPQKNHWWRPRVAPLKHENLSCCSPYPFNTSLHSNFNLKKEPNPSLLLKPQPFLLTDTPKRTKHFRFPFSF